MYANVYVETFIMTVLDIWMTMIKSCMDSFICLFEGNLKPGNWRHFLKYTIKCLENRAKTGDANFFESSQSAKFIV